MVTQDLVTEQLRALQVPTTDYLWTPAFPVNFTPAVLSQIFGDGRALFRFTTINNRPAYWIVRGCSSWSVEDPHAPFEAPEFGDFSEDVLCAIEEEFGGTSNYEMNQHGRWVDRETKQFIPRVDTAYPVIDDRTGCSWGRMSWPRIEGLSLVPHPFDRHTLILAEPS